MSDDFVRLVSQANPASRRQYQPANTGYPPSSSPSNAMDPFFDDDDDVPDSAFGHAPAMQSKESGLPFAHSGAPPAGVGNSQLSLPTIQPDQWSFDDDPGSKSFAGSSSFPGSSTGRERKPVKPPKKKWKLKWPWQKKEETLTGNRVIALNNPDANGDFCNNYISTSKYNLATFVPKFLFGAWHFVLNRWSATLTLHLHVQSNSRSTRTCSSCSPPSSSRYPTCHPRTVIPPLLPLLLYC